MTSGFAGSFWSSDYAGGLGVLFQKLQQGVQENQQILTIARLRADAEEAYGNSLASITPATERISGGFGRDEGASVRKAYEGVRTEMEVAAQNHRKIASNIRELVVNPFSRWADQHAARVQNSQDDLQARIKLHDRQADAVRKFRSQYYNKCRLVEDLEEEDKLAFQDPQSEVSQSPRVKVPTIKMSEPEESDDDPIELGDETYQPEQVKKILTHVLETIKLQEVRVPILGTYQNCSTGADITEYIQKHMAATSVSYAERIGQDLISAGFLRLVGNVGNTFANSSRMNYQWKSKVFQITGIPEKKKGLERSGTVMSTMSQDSFTVDSPVGAVQELISGWNPLNNPYPNETPAERLRREAREADERYKAAVKKLDSLRCNLEEAMIDHLKFMERCELDRLKAIKAVILDFSGAISNVIPSLQSTVDKMMLFQETIQPLGDVRYLLENYRTGPFHPKVVTYENYYNSVDEQTFGVDLEARARSDRKRVPVIVTTILTFLDNHYPDLEGDEARRGIWLVDVPLAQTHSLRAAINTGKTFPHEILEKYDIPIVASVLKLYLLELPDSLVSSHVYEIVKTIYSTTATETSEETRISVIQSTLGQLRLANIATLDAITTHFTRLIELTSADETYVAALANTLAPCILRPRVESSLTMNERYSYRLIRDLFAHKEAIFGELKRASTLTHSASGAQRPRAISTDESNRRANYEERNRAIAAQRSPRATSPAPGPRNGIAHRRDRSQTRFPVNTSSPTERRGTVGSRNSLEVPGTADSPVVDDKGLNGNSDAQEHPSPSSTRVPFPRKHAGSLARSNRDSLSSMKGEDSGPRGVQLEDKPMDD
ncbi:rho-GTPase-activating protein-like protein [Westerdykella ornata]|uniref:Rho-GTPase-activating protein-like protein n=1 Tax=Westerdykella ornata TaxID=318751 RepID=A0A6A6JW32_WESOR|nr:rho-GTPase-activating protein-like protein [Westerdykella ornata]KAF2280821.1 rho-GTPase-activating protein-like protein [Westerdykella ornata]